MRVDAHALHARVEDQTCVCYDLVAVMAEETDIVQQSATTRRENRCGEILARLLDEEGAFEDPSADEIPTSSSSFNGSTTNASMVSATGKVDSSPASATSTRWGGILFFPAAEVTGRSNAYYQ